MKLKKYACLYSKPLGNHTVNIMKKYLKIYFKKPGKIMEISWNFISPEKWEPWSGTVNSNTVNSKFHLIQSKNYWVAECPLVLRIGG